MNLIIPKVVKVKIAQDNNTEGVSAFGYEFFINSFDYDPESITEYADFNSHYSSVDSVGRIIERFKKIKISIKREDVVINFIDVRDTVITGSNWGKNFECRDSYKQLKSNVDIIGVIRMSYINSNNTVEVSDYSLLNGNSYDRSTLNRIKYNYQLDVCEGAGHLR